MIKNIIALITQLSKLSTRQLVVLSAFIILLCTLLLGTAWSYFLIQQMSQKVDKIERTVDYNSSGSAFMELFGDNSLDFEIRIKRRLQKVRIKTDANRIIMFGFHNGQVIGARTHLKKMSAIIEDFDIGNGAIIQNLQNMHISIFAENVQRIFDEEYVCQHVDEIEEATTNAQLKSQGVYYQIVTVIRNSNNVPIGLIGLYYDRSEAEHLLNDNTLQQEYITEILEAKKYIELQFRRLENSQ